MMQDGRSAVIEFVFQLFEILVQCLIMLDNENLVSRMAGGSVSPAGSA